LFFDGGNAGLVRGGAGEGDYGGRLDQSDGAGDGAPSEELDERQKRVAALVAQLTTGISVAESGRTGEQAAMWMLAQLLDGIGGKQGGVVGRLPIAGVGRQRVAGRARGIAGLKFVARIGIERKIPTDRYRFEKQETEVRCDRDVFCRGERFGCVVGLDLGAMTVDVKKPRRQRRYIHLRCMSGIGL